MCKGSGVAAQRLLLMTRAAKSPRRPRDKRTTPASPHVHARLSGGSQLVLVRLTRHCGCHNGCTTTRCSSPAQLSRNLQARTCDDNIMLSMITPRRRPALACVLRPFKRAANVLPPLVCWRSVRHCTISFVCVSITFLRAAAGTSMPEHTHSVYNLSRLRDSHAPICLLTHEQPSQYAQATRTTCCRQGLQRWLRA